MKPKIAMFNPNRKSTFRSTLLALILGGGAGFLGSPAWAAEPEYGGTLTVTGELVLYPPASWDPAEWIWTSMIWTEPFLQSLLLGDFAKNGPRGTNEWHYQGYAGAPYHLVKGLLAESWTVPDNKTIIFKYVRASCGMKCRESWHQGS